MPGYTLSKKAEEDIVDMFVDGAKKFGLDQAERYHDELSVCFTFLAQNPLSARIRNELNPPVRVHPFRAHIVIYTVEADGSIFIVRVRHGREDWL